MQNNFDNKDLILFKLYSNPSDRIGVLELRTHFVGKLGVESSVVDQIIFDLIADGNIVGDSTVTPLFYSLTEKGRNHIKQYIQKISQKDYLKLLSLFPEDELKYRISLIERLIIFGLSFIAVFYFSVDTWSIGFLNRALLSVFLGLLTFYSIILFVTDFLNRGLIWFLPKISERLFKTFIKYKNFFMPFFVLLVSFIYLGWLFLNNAPIDQYFILVITFVYSFYDKIKIFFNERIIG